MTAEPRARREFHVPERLGGGGVDHLPHIDPQLVADDRHFVDQPDVHAPEGVLQELDQLGRLGRRDRHQRVDGGLVQGAHHPAAILRDASDHFQGVLGLVDGIPRIHPLGAEGEKKSLPTLSPVDSSAGSMISRGSRIRGAFEDDRLAGPEHLLDRVGGGDDVADVGILNLESGVGTQIEIASASRSLPPSRVAVKRPEAMISFSCASGTSLTWDRPLLRPSTTRWLTSNPRTR